MPYSAGTAYLTVVPSFLNIQREFQRISAELGKEVEKSVSDAIPEGMRESVKKAAKQGDQAGKEFGGAFEAARKRHLDAAAKSFPKIDLDADPTDAQRAIAQIREDLETIRDAKIDVDLNEKELFAEVARIKKVINDLDGQTVSVELRTNLASSRDQLSAIEKLADQFDPQAVAQAQAQARIAGAQAGSQYGGAFAQQARRRIEAGLAAMEIPPPDIKSAGTQAKIAALRERLEELLHVDVDVDIPAHKYMAELITLENELEAIERDEVNIRIKSNITAVLDQVRALREFAGVANPQHVARDREEAQRSEAQARIDAAQAGSKYGGAFAQQARRRIEAGLAGMEIPPPGIKPTGVEAKMAAIRERLEELLHVDVDVDIPAHKYMAELAALQGELEAIERDEVNVRIRSNARTVLGEVRALREFVDGPQPAEEGEKSGGAFADAFNDAVKAGLSKLPEVKLRANTAGLNDEIDNMRAELESLANVKVGVDVDAAEAMRRIDVLEKRARELSGMDIDVDARTNFAEVATKLAVIQAMVKRLDDQDVDVDVNVRGGLAGLQQLAETAGVSMSRLGTLVSLGASIGTAIVPAAAAAAAALSALATAAGSAVLGVGVLGLGLFGVVKAVGALDKYQKDANKSATSLSGAQDRVANAVASVSSAQRSLVRVERERQQALEGLVRAQEEARRQLQDMAQSVKANALAQRQANLDAAESKRALDRVLANPRATQEEREQARITYEQRLLQIEDLGIQQERLAADKAKADKAGVAGSQQVVAAQERIADSNDALISAQEQLAQSQRALAAAYEKTGTAGGEALDNLQEAMDALSPAGRRFALFIFSLKDEFKGLQAAAEGGLLPGLEAGIRNLLPLMPAVEKLVGDVATALGGIFVDFTEAMKDPVWQEFFGYLAATAAPTLQGMAQFALNVATGVAGILNSLSGFNGPIGEGLLKWSEGFANWSRELDTNTGWQAFLGYIRQAAPVVLDFLGNLWDFTKKIVEAAAPIGLVVVQAFSKLFEILAGFDVETWTIIIAAIAGIGAALLVVSAITAAIGTGITGAIVGGVAAVAAGLVLLYQNIEPLRAAVDATVQAISAAWSGLWTNVLQPVFRLIVADIEVLKEHWNDLYQDVFVRVFGAIGAVMSAWWQTTKTIFDALSPLFSVFQAAFGVAFGLFQVAVKAAGAVFSWLWEHALRPIFQVVGVAFSIFQAIFQVAFGLFQIGVKIIAAIFLWFYDKAIKPVIDLLRPIFVWLGEVISKYVAPPFKAGLEAMGKAWDFLVEAAKTPIKFLIETVLNNGLLAGYNKIAKAFNVKPDDVKIDLPASWSTPLPSSAAGFRGYAKGGRVWGEGTRTSDSILARLSRDEHVWTADEVDAAGGHAAMYRMRRAVLDGVLPGFATGGAVGDFFSGLVKKAGDVFSGITDFFTDPTGALKRLADQLFDLVPGKDSDFMKVALGVPRKAADFAIDKIKGFLAAGTGVQAGNAGPTGAGPGFLPWPPSPGAQRGDSGVWHNILDLVRSSGIPYSFGNSYRHGDPLWHGSGRAIDFTGYNQDALAQFFMNMQGRVLELIHTTGRGGYYISRGQRRNSMGAQDALHRDHLHIAMDEGGMLQPGWNPPIWNGTGRVEPVLNPQQWDSIYALARGGDGARASYHFQFKDTTLDPGKLRALQDREDARTRQGRAR